MFSKKIANLKAFPVYVLLLYKITSEKYQEMLGLAKRLDELAQRLRQCETTLSDCEETIDDISSDINFQIQSMNAEYEDHCEAASDLKKKEHGSYMGNITNLKE